MVLPEGSLFLQHRSPDEEYTRSRDLSNRQWMWNVSVKENVSCRKPLRCGDYYFSVTQQESTVRTRKKRYLENEGNTSRKSEWSIRPRATER